MIFVFKCVFKGMTYICLQKEIYETNTTTCRAGLG